MVQTGGQKLCTGNITQKETSTNTTNEFAKAYLCINDGCQKRAFKEPKEILRTQAHLLACLDDT